MPTVRFTTNQPAMVDTTETRWFKILFLIVTGFFVGFSIANIIYFNRIRSGVCSAITENEATSMLWVNVILLILAGLMFIWGMFRLIFSRAARQDISHRATSYIQGEGTGLVNRTPWQQARTAPVVKRPIVTQSQLENTAAFGTATPTLLTSANASADVIDPSAAATIAASQVAIEG